jgi:hypothetical protein
LQDLTAAGIERIFDEQVSSAAKRVKLAECLAFMREGDVLTVTKPDRQTEPLLRPGRIHHTASGQENYQAPTLLPVLQPKTATSWNIHLLTGQQRLKEEAETALNCLNRH